MDKQFKLEAEKYAKEQCGNMYDDKGLTGAEWGWETAKDFTAGATSEAAKKYWFEQFKQKYLTPEHVTRVEVINHASVTEDCGVGRVFTHYDVKSCELSFQDSMKTLKIFI